MLNKETYLKGGPKGSVSLAAGTNTFKFSLKLDQKLPSSHKDRFGELKYYVIVSVRGAKKTMKCDPVEFHVVGLGNNEGFVKSIKAAAQSQELMLEKKMLFNCGRVTVRVGVASGVAFLGESIKLNFMIVNATKKVLTIAFKFLQKCDYS